MRAKVTVNPASRIGGEVMLAGDKSISHRALIFAALGQGRCVIENLAEGEDIEATIRCLEQLGASIRREGATVLVEGGELSAPSAPLDCGNSGTTIRLLAGLVAGLGFAATLDGDESLRRRPMGRVLDPLREMGARCEGARAAGGEERAPLRFHGQGQLHGVAHTLPVASAQVKSALLLAGLYAEGETAVREPHRSRDHTERMLAAFSPSQGRLPLSLPSTLRIPGDPSSAAFLAVAATLLPGQGLTLPHVAANPTRLGWVRVLEEMGGRIELEEEEDVAGEPVCTLTLRQAPRLDPFQIEGAQIPALIDEVPILAVLATQAEGVSTIRGAGELRIKESDRLAAMARWLGQMGARIDEEADGLTIHGPTTLRGAQVEAEADHRVAMSLAVAALVADGPTSIEGGDWAAISFPGFYSLLRELTT